MCICLGEQRLSSHLTVQKNVPIVFMYYYVSLICLTYFSVLLCTVQLKLSAVHIIRIYVLLQNY